MLDGIITNSFSLVKEVNIFPLCLCPTNNIGVRRSLGKWEHPLEICLQKAWQAIRCRPNTKHHSTKHLSKNTKNVPSVSHFIRRLLFIILRLTLTWFVNVCELSVTPYKDGHIKSVCT